ncbi:MAG: hypothetical protein Q8P23_00170 [bacterium]|nr:hypothetical protein [bacterium]
MLIVKTSEMVPSRADELRGRIEKQFEGVEYLGTVEIHTVNTFVFIKKNSKETSQPYFRLRVYLTGDASMDAGDIERRLEALDIKVDMHDLRKVIHAEK